MGETMEGACSDATGDRGLRIEQRGQDAGVSPQALRSMAASLTGVQAQTSVGLFLFDTLNFRHPLLELWGELRAGDESQLPLVGACSEPSGGPGTSGTKLHRISIAVPILQMRKQRLREVTGLAQNYQK